MSRTCNLECLYTYVKLHSRISPGFKIYSFNFHIWSTILQRSLETNRDPQHISLLSLFNGLHFRAHFLQVKEWLPLTCRTLQPLALQQKLFPFNFGALSLTPSMYTNHLRPKFWGKSQSIYATESLALLHMTLQASTLLSHFAPLCCILHPLRCGREILLLHIVEGPTCNTQG